MINIQELINEFDNLQEKIKTMDYDTALYLYKGYNEYDDGDSIQFDFYYGNFIFTIRKYHDRDDLILCNEFVLSIGWEDFEFSRC